jgi:hypothetical protein
MRRPILMTALLATFRQALALNITIYQHGVPLMPNPLPPSHAASDGGEIISLFQGLGRSTVWKSIANITFQGDTYEPEGMVRLASHGVERYIVSAGEYTAPTTHYNQTINGTDREPGAGFAHLIVFDSNGTRIADATLTAQGDIEYHNGGIDYDGQHIWCTIAQYRPNTTAHVARVDPCTLQPTTIFHIKDHEGGIVHDVQTNNIWTLDWGSRNESLFNLNRLPHNAAHEGVFTRPEKVNRNPSYFVDYQDCKFLGRSQLYADRPVMLCSGVATIANYSLGGIALVDVETMAPLAEVPIPLVSSKGVSLTQNPVEVSVVDGKLRLYWLPDQHNSTLYVYEAQPDSPFEFGGTGGLY